MTNDPAITLEVDGVVLVLALVVAILTLRVPLVVLYFKKGKASLGVFGIFVPLVALVGAIRLGTPSSSWARRYGPDKMAEAMTRFSGDPLSREFGGWKLIGDLVPGDAVANSGRLHYTVDSPLTVDRQSKLSMNVTYADGTRGTRTWLAEQSDFLVPIWNAMEAQEAVVRRREMATSRVV